MSGEIAGLADQVVEVLAHWWPAVGGVAGGVAVGVVDRLRDKATEAASDAAVWWVRRVVLRVFARRADGTPVDPDAPIPADAVVAAEVDETLNELAADPESRSARRLLARYITDAAATDRELVAVLRELVAQAPAVTGSVGVSGGIRQEGSGGVNIANTGVAGNIDVGRNTR